MRRPRLSVPKALLSLCIVFTGLGLLFLNLGFVDPPIRLPFPVQPQVKLRHSSNPSETQPVTNRTLPSACATVEEMGAGAAAAPGGDSREESLRIRRLIQEHFALQGASRVRSLPPEQFCQQGFVLGKASEAGLGNEMFQGTTDAVAAQFFLKNVHPQMRSSASTLFGTTESLHSRPNLFGELLRVIVSPSMNVEEAVNWALNGGPDPHLALHMRMLMNRSVRAVTAVLNCIRKALLINHNQLSRPRVVLVSDTPSLIRDITPKLEEFAEVIHFDYKLFEGNISGRKATEVQDLSFRVKDWGPAPRWVAFVDFFLASRAQHAVVSGAQRRVGTTYAQLIAALAAAHQLSEDHSQPSNFSFFSSFQSNLLSEGLKNQVGWGHVWNRFAGPLSCHSQPNQCALTPLLPPGWWDGILQSPIPRDIRRMEAFGVRLSGLGTVDENYLQSFCKSRTDIVKTIPIKHHLKNAKDETKLANTNTSSLARLVPVESLNTIDRIPSLNYT
ncbi:hypothetical protein RJ640_014031 [Escallonia rubra]|uniref:Uncharacterized protein n=1 Tax=Escallonia rubra TaxID=112253 RepID=A0AA88R8J4_9ASTE|nr:hypothetical protein RJ640_014031 [Escallonia rubra]